MTLTDGSRACGGSRRNSDLPARNRSNASDPSNRSNAPTPLAPPDAAPDASAHLDLARLGIRPGDRVRFRRKPEANWQQGTAIRRERDGSLRVHDTKGAARAIPLELVEVKGEGPRGAARWEPLLDRAARVEQLRLL